MVSNLKKIYIISLIVVIGVLIFLFVNKLENNQPKAVQKQLSEKPILPKGKYSPRLKLRKNSYRLHRKVAKSSGVDVINSFDEIPKYVKSGKLVKIENKQGYVIHKLTHSKPYLNKKSAKILEQIGQQFYADTDAKAYFTVTSLTRSNGSQKKLSKKNINATRGISTHCYGASFDISYMRFNGVKEWNDPLKVKLELILAKLQKEGKIYVLREKQSACYHITTR
jgi:hypothetical protein